MRVRSCIGAAAIGLFAWSACAQVVITSSITVNEGSTLLQNQDVIVRGATLTLNGAHTLRSLTIERGPTNLPGLVRHAFGFEGPSGPGCVLTVTNNLHIQGTNGGLIGSRIDMSGRGIAPGSGPGAGTPGAGTNLPGGGGYGGQGGRGGGAAGGNGGVVYGDLYRPRLLGSPSGLYNGLAGLSDRGGGALRLEVGGTLEVNGSIVANGANTNNGGGSGGSIFIRAGAIIGVGTITANGASAAASWGGGGGGRIAVYSCANMLPVGNFSVQGGAATGSGQPGQPGSVLFGSGSVVITQQPLVERRTGGGFEISVGATGDGDVAYQWRRDGEVVIDGPMEDGIVISGASTSTLSITGAGCGFSSVFDCLLTDVCGVYPSEPALAEVVNPADWNNDDGIDDLDISAFFVSFELGEADINGDDGVDDLDITFFFTLFEQGC